MKRKPTVGSVARYAWDLSSADQGRAVAQIIAQCQEYGDCLPAFVNCLSVAQLVALARAIEKRIAKLLREE